MSSPPISRVDFFPVTSFTIPATVASDAPIAAADSTNESSESVIMDLASELRQCQLEDSYHKLLKDRLDISIRRKEQRQQITHYQTNQQLYHLPIGFIEKVNAYQLIRIQQLGIALVITHLVCPPEGAHKLLIDVYKEIAKTSCPVTLYLASETFTNATTSYVRDLGNLIGKNILKVIYGDVEKAHNRQVQERLEHLLQHCPNLTHLHLSDCKSLTGEHLVSLVEKAPFLKELYLSRCVSISETSLANCLRIGKRLEVLDLSGCRLSKAIFESLQGIDTLRHLLLKDCASLTDELLEHLSTSAFLLETLDLSGSPSFSETCLAAVLEQHFFAQINTTNCPQIRQEFIDRLLKTIPLFSTLESSELASCDQYICTYLGLYLKHLLKVPVQVSKVEQTVSIRIDGCKNDLYYRQPAMFDTLSSFLSQHALQIDASQKILSTPQNSQIHCFLRDIAPMIASLTLFGSPSAALDDNIWLFEKLIALRLICCSFTDRELLQVKTLKLQSFEVSSCTRLTASFFTQIPALYTSLKTCRVLYCPALDLEAIAKITNQMSGLTFEYSMPKIALENGHTLNQEEQLALIKALNQWQREECQLVADSLIQALQITPNTLLTILKVAIECELSALELKVNEWLLTHFSDVLQLRYQLGRIVLECSNLQLLMQEPERIAQLIAICESVRSDPSKLDVRLVLPKDIGLLDSAIQQVFRLIATKTDCLFLSSPKSTVSDDACLIAILRVFKGISQLSIANLVITQLLLENMAIYSAQLQELHFNNVQGVCTKTLAKLCHQWKGLFSFSFIFMPDISDRDIQVIARSYGLRQLRVQNCTQITSNVMSILSTMAPKLVLLDLSGCRIDDRALAANVLVLPDLATLILNKTAITDRGITLLCSVYRRIQVLHVAETKVSFTMSEKVPLPILQELDLSDCANICHTSIRTLRANYRLLSRVALRRCKQVSEQSLLELCSELAIQTVDARGCDLVHPTLAYKYLLFDQSRQYKLTVNFHLDYSVYALKLLLCRASHISSLTLSNPAQMTRSHIKALADSPTLKNVQSLTLDDCRCTSTELYKFLAQAMPQLKKLSWRGPIDVLALVIIVQFRQLKDLTLCQTQGNMLADDQFDLLGAGFEEAESLTLEGFQTITPAAIQRLIQRSKKLKRVRTVQCPLLTESELAKLKVLPTFG